MHERNAMVWSRVMSLLRPHSVFALAVVAASVSACSSAPDGQSDVGVTSSDIVCESTNCGGGGGGGRPVICSEYFPGCTVTPHANGWADAKAATIYFDMSMVYPWLDALQQAGCTTPSMFQGTQPHDNFWLSTCPDSVLSSVPLPALPGWNSYSLLMLNCDACVPHAPGGSVNLGWNTSGDSPGGCKAGSCASSPGY